MTDNQKGKASANQLLPALKLVLKFRKTSNQQIRIKVRKKTAMVVIQELEISERERRKKMSQKNRLMSQKLATNDIQKSVTLKTENRTKKRLTVPCAE